MRPGKEVMDKASYERVKRTLKVGCFVTTRFYRGEENVIRTLLTLEEDHRYGSGFKASASGGPSCPTCGHANARLIYPVDASWFHAVDEEAAT